MRKKSKSGSYKLPKLKFLQGDIVIRSKRLPKAMLIGIIGVILLYVGTAGLVSVIAPWWVGKGDSPRHIDYAWRIYHGDIPKFDDGIRYQPLAELGKGRYINQPASANPPLFYILHAPLIGPLLDKGEWQKATAVGRAFNIFLGVLCVLALAWAGWLFGGKRKAIFAVSVPALAVMVHHFTSLNLNYAVDVLLVLFSTLAFITTYKLLLHGLKWRYVGSLTLLSVLGMATKAPYIIILFISLIGLVAAAVIHGGSDKKKSAIRGLLFSTAIFSLVVIAIGWFYYFQNFMATGRWYSNFHFVSGRPHRPYKSFTTVITSRGLWSLLYASYAAVVAASVALTSFALAGVFSIIDKNRLSEIWRTKQRAMMVGLFALAVVGLFTTQIVEAVGSGNYYFRYLLPVILPISLFLAYGLLEFRWTRGMLVVFFSVLLGLCTIYVTPKSSAITYTLPSISKVPGPVNRIEYATANNGIPIYIDKLLYITFILGAIALLISLIILTKKTRSYSPAKK